MYRTADFQFSRGPEPPVRVGQVANVPSLHESVFGCNEARDVKSVSQPFSPFGCSTLQPKTCHSKTAVPRKTAQDVVASIA